MLVRNYHTLLYCMYVSCISIYKNIRCYTPSRQQITQHILQQWLILSYIPGTLLLYVPVHTSHGVPPVSGGGWGGGWV